MNEQTYKARAREEAQRIRNLAESLHSELSFESTIAEIEDDIALSLEHFFREGRIS